MGKANRPHPLKLRTFQILLLLGDGPLHGWSIVKALQAQVGDDVRILPGSLYRTLNEMTEEGLIEEAPGPDSGDEDGRRRYLRVTDLGIEATRAEAARLEQLVQTAQSKNVFFPRKAKA